LRFFAQCNGYLCFIKSRKFLHYLTTLKSPLRVLHHGISKKPGQMLALTFGYVTANPSLTASENPPYENLSICMAMESH